jgi:putative sugar O-methyltransferase
MKNQNRLGSIIDRFSLKNVAIKLKCDHGTQSNIYAHAEQYRSESENGAYAAAVLRALEDQKSFDNFKRIPAYQEILEHVTKQQGEAYLDILKSRNDGMLEKALETVLVSDSTGNPVKYNYKNLSIPLSPTTLRYVKVASDLKHLFGSGLDEVAEIGCGYGGQCLVNDALLDYKHSVLFDLSFVNRLIERYLDYTLMNGAYEVTTINQQLPRQYDLVISNYAFSELPAELQRMYIKKVLANSKRGYLTMNSGIAGALNTGKLSIQELRDLLPPFECLIEEPLTYEHNYIMVWGHKEDSINGVFTQQ